MQLGLTTCARPGVGAQIFNGLEKTAVGALEVGMFVAELNRPWLETPFLIQGFEIRHQSQIRILMSHCRHVYVARERSRMVGGEKTLAPAGIRCVVHHTEKVGELYQVRRWGKPARQRPLRSQPAHVNSVPVEKEHGPVRTIYDQARTDIADLLCSVSVGQMLDTDRAEQVVGLVRKVFYAIRTPCCGWPK